MSILSLLITAPLPSVEMRKFEQRREQCTHWADEEPYDRSRANQIAAAMRRLRCDTIDGDEARLRRRHAGDQAALRLLDRPAAD